MAEASKVSGEKYRRIFSEYDPVFVDAVSSAALSCNLNFFLKKEQMQALSEYVKGKDVVVNLPTGYGKSLIYSLCPLVCDNLRNVKSKKERSMLLLISPLTALMDDQRLSLAQLGLSSLKLTPNVSEADISRIQSGDIQVIILSPESFECVVVKRTLQSAKERIHYVAIDEAHCIEEWLVFTYNKLHNCVKFLDCVFFWLSPYLVLLSYFVFIFMVKKAFYIYKIV